MKHLLISLAVCTALFTSCKQAPVTTLYDFTAVANNGTEVSLKDYEGQVVLIVNTASKCGFTPQYDGLEALYQQYKDRGFTVIGFPCDQFGHQEPGTDSEIEAFCRLNHGVTFPLMSKSEVNGANANPVFVWLYGEKPFAGFGEGETAVMMDKMLGAKDPDYAGNPDIKWNFTKFLIDRKGRVVARYEPTVAPEAIAAEIESLLD